MTIDMNKYYLMKPVKEPYGLTEVYREDEVTMLKKNEKSGSITPDFLQKPCPMISDRVKQLFEKFIGEGLYKLCVIQNDPHTIFWEFSPAAVPEDAARYTPGGDVNAILDFGLEPFLKVEGRRKTSFIISRIVAESLLRRGYNILELSDVDTIALDGEESLCEDI